MKVRFNLLAASALAAGVFGCNREKEPPRSGAPTDTAAAASATTPPAAPASTPPTNYVGLQYDSLPASFTYKGGSMIPRSANGPAGDYDFSHVMTPRGEMIWLDTVGAAPAHGPPPHMVRAELTIPPLAMDERVVMASCDVNGALDPLVVAIVVAEPNTAHFTKVRQAWRVNIRGARFDVIPVNGVTCDEPGA